MAIPNDITEGINRHHGQESVEFLVNAQEALSTLQNCLITARDLKDLNNEDFNPLLEQITKINSKLQDLLAKLG